MRTPFIAVTILSLTLVTVAEAQRGPRGGDRPTPPTPEEMRDLMVIELDMDAEQASALDAIFAAHADSLTAGREAMESARDLRGQMREARDAGDEDELARLRDEMRGAFEVGREAMTTYMDEVETILTDDQKARLGDLMPGRGGRGGGRGPGARDGRSPIERFNDAIANVDITADQEAQIAQFLGEMEPQIEARREIFETMRPLFEEMREARQLGDDVRVEELRAEIRAQRPERGNLMRDFVAGLEEILTPEQMQELRENAGMGRGGRNASGPGGRGRGPEGGAGLREIMRVLRNLDLTQEQRSDIRSALQETRRAASQEREGQRQEHFDDLVAAIKSVLTEEQAAQFDAELAEIKQRQGERGQRGDRARDRGGRERGERGDRARGGGGRERGERGGGRRGARGGDATE